MNYLLSNFIEILFGLALTGNFVLKVNNRIDQQAFLIISVVILIALALKHLLNIYLNFVTIARSTPNYPDNRTANFLTFDLFKFILILFAVLAVTFLGINKILSNDTIAALLGGLIGSLLTMKGSYFDLKIDKDLLASIQQQNNANPSAPKENQGNTPSVPEAEH